MMKEIAPNLYLIPLDQGLTGFTSFICSWLYKTDDLTFLVDVGPSGTIPVLVNALKQLSIKKLDMILLTHIHIDHAGGIGDFISQFPDTPIICHGSGIRHLQDPSRLWEGSLKTLGRTAEVYGPIQPVPPGLLQDGTSHSQPLPGKGIQTFITPGHASHHLSFLFGDYLFAGEAGGVFMALSGDQFYLRPATPPRFFLETSVQSIDTLLNIPHQYLCYGHFGMTSKTPQILELHKKQLFQWAEIIREEMKKDHSSDFVDHCIQVLLEKDPLLETWKYLTPAIQERERGFLRNSVRGFIGYLKS